MTDNEVPESVLQIAKRAALEHPDDIDQAVACLRAKVVETKLEKALLSVLLARAYRDLIHQARHQHFVALRNANGSFVGKAKVMPGSAVAMAAEASLLNTYCIAGRTLGSIRGEEIASMAATETAKANGAAFNASLLIKLRRFVKDEATVGESVNDKQVAKMFRDLQNRAA